MTRRVDGIAPSSPHKTSAAKPSPSRYVAPSVEQKKGLSATPEPHQLHRSVPSPHAANNIEARTRRGASFFGPPPSSSSQSRSLSPPAHNQGRGWRLLAAAFVILVAIVGSVHFLHRAWVSLTFEDQILQKTFPLSAALNAGGTDGPGSTTLLYPVQVEVTTDTVVEAQGTAYQESPAHGKIEIRNYWSKNPLPLVRRSRFQDSNGTIFRSQQVVEVPGYSQSATGEIIPGTTTVEVIADTTGPTGNIQKGTPLLLPAFEGKPQHERISAIAVEDFTGGFAGEVPRVDDEALAALIARETMRIQKQASKLPEVARSISPGARLARQEPEVRLISHSLHPLSGGSARVALHFSVQVYAFDPAAAIPIVFASPPPQTNILPSSVEVAINDETATVSALARVALAPETIAAKTVGLLKEEAARELSSLPFVQETRVSVFPFWRQRLPARPERITVTITYVRAGSGEGGVDNAVSVR